MKDKKAMTEMQRDFVAKMKEYAVEFAEHIDKSDIQAVLLSGSVARGDFYPGEYGGMIDLVIMKKSGHCFDAEKILGKDEEPDIPYHCVRRNFYGSEICFEIDVRDFVSAEQFEQLDESRKFSIIESEIIYDAGNLYRNEFQKILLLKDKELHILFDSTLQGIDWMLSPYTTDKWFRRQAFVQMHWNLNSAVRMGVKCLYYKNGSYVPPENRMLYYTYTLEKLPEQYSRLIAALFRQNIESYADYERRGKLFREQFLGFLRTKQ